MQDTMVTVQGGVLSERQVDTTSHLVEGKYTE